MKKIALLLVLSLLVLGVLTACQEPEPAPTAVTVRIAGMTGPTSMGLVKLAEDDANGTAQQDYSIKTTYAKGDEITPLLIKGELYVIIFVAVFALIVGHTNFNRFFCGSQKTCSANRACIFITHNVFMFLRSGFFRSGFFRGGWLIFGGF